MARDSIADLASNQTIPFNAQTEIGIAAETVDCRGEAGITVGLIDGIISMARILVRRDLSNPHVVEALKDMASDEDIRLLNDTARSLMQGAK